MLSSEMVQLRRVLVPLLKQHGYTTTIDYCCELPMWVFLADNPNMKDVHCNTLVEVETFVEGLIK